VQVSRSVSRRARWILALVLVLLALNAAAVEAIAAWSGQLYPAQATPHAQPGPAPVAP
jgi:hypothetical protein